MLEIVLYNKDSINARVLFLTISRDGGSAVPSQGSSKRKNFFHSPFRMALVLCGSMLVGYFFAIWIMDLPGSAHEDFPIGLHGLHYPTDRLITTSARSGFQDGDMFISIEAIGLSATVFGGVNEDTLSLGLGLYDFAVLPGYSRGGYIDNFNISLAGHREIFGLELYRIDDLAYGDQAEVFYRGRQYTFSHLDTTIASPDDLSILFSSDRPLLTLVSTYPIGVGDRLIVARFELIAE